MKVLLIALLLTMKASSRQNSLFTDNFTEDLNRDITNMLKNDDEYQDLDHFGVRNNRQLKERHLAKIEYKRLTQKYNNLKGRYERLLTLYKAKGYLAHDSPLESDKELDLSRMPKKHARKLVKLRKMTQQHQRKMQDYDEYHHFYSETDYSPHPNDSWLTSAVKNTANALGIHDSSDAVIAGAGAGTLMYGLNKRKQQRHENTNKGLYMQKMYVLKEGLAKMLGREIRSLSTLIDMLEQASRRATLTSDNICAGIDAKSMNNGGY